MYFINSEINPVPAGFRAERKLIAHDGSMMMTEIHFTEGADGAPHDHPHEQISYVVSGEILFRLGKEEMILKPGDSVYIPSSVPHCLRANSDSVVLDVFTPQREDFLL